MIFDRQKIYDEYMTEVDKLFEQNEFMVSMTGKDCVNTVCKVIEKLYKQKFK